MQKFLSSLILITASIYSINSKAYDAIKDSDSEGQLLIILDLLDELDMDSLTDSQKNQIIKDLLSVDLSSLQLIKNGDVDTEEYRVEAGSHSFGV